MPSPPRLARNGPPQASPAPHAAPAHGLERELHRATERLALAIRAGGVGTWDYDVVNNVLAWDDEMFRLYGISREQFGGAYDAWRSGLHPEDRARGDEEIQQALSGERDFDTEFRVCWPDGSIRHIRALASVERSPDGRPVSMIGTNWDITDQKRTEAALKGSERAYRDLFETNRSVMLLIDPTDGAVIDANAAATAYYGYSHRQLQQMRVSDINVLPEAEVRRLMASVESGRSDSFHFQHRLADGSIRDVEVSTTRLRFGERDVLHSIIHDLTARRRAEAALHESGTNFRLFFETMSDMIMVGTPEGRILFTNPAVTRILGYSADELCAMHLLQLHPPDRRGEAEQIFGAMFRGERQNCPLPLAKKDGTLVPVETRVWMGTWSGEPCVFGISKDLSREQEAHQRFERLFRSNPNPMALTSVPEGRFLDVNSAFTSAVGYSKDEVIGRTAAELNLFVNPERQIVAAQRLEDEGLLPDVELQVRSKNGAVLDGLFSGELIDSQGTRTLLTVMVDITARKRAEAAVVAERDFWQQVMRSMGHGMTVTDASGRFVVVNPAYASLVGATPEELVGLNPADVTAPADIRILDEMRERRLRGESSTYETGLVSTDGSEVPVQITAVPRWKDGVVVGTIANVIDLTERKRAEQRLARALQLQHVLRNLATEFINVPLSRQKAAVDEALAAIGDALHASRAILFAYDFDQQVATADHEWHAPGVTPVLERLSRVPLALFPHWVDAHRAGETVVRDDLWSSPERRILEDGLGLPHPAQSTLSQPLMHAGACLGFVMLTRIGSPRRWQEEDVSVLEALAELYVHFKARQAADDRMRTLQERLTEARDRATAAAGAKSLFLANMSHEIRTPLNAILGYAQIMARECQPCPVKHRLTTISRSGEHLLHLITDLLELVRSDGNTIVLSPSTFSVRRMLDDVRLMFAQRAGDQGLSFDITVDEHVPPFVRTDKGKVVQVLTNLIGNAVKFTATGGVQLRAGASAPGPEGQTSLRWDVIDTGPGIGAADLDKVFDVFHQAEAGIRRGGTGLGLALSRRYARALGGDITVSSREGGGSRFRFTCTAEIVAIGEDSEEASAAVRRISGGQHVPRVLVVDDDPSNRTMLENMLRPVGFIVESAEDAQSALERLAAPPAFDLVLMDKHMPDMDGYEAIRRLRRLPRGSTTPVAVVTAAGFSDERDKALLAGADGYVSKPVRREQLLAEAGRLTGIRYDTDSMPTAGPSDGPGNADPVSLIAAVPAALRRNLALAVGRGHIKRVRAEIDVIARDHPRAAAVLGRLAQSYQYDRLTALLARGHGETS